MNVVWFWHRRSSILFVLEMWRLECDITGACGKIFFDWTLMCHHSIVTRRALQFGRFCSWFSSRTWSQMHQSSSTSKLLPRERSLAPSSWPRNGENFFSRLPKGTNSRKLSVGKSWLLDNIPAVLLVVSQQSLFFLLPWFVGDTISTWLCHDPSSWLYNDPAISSITVCSRVLHVLETWGWTRTWKLCCKRSRGSGSGWFNLDCWLSSL